MRLLRGALLALLLLAPAAGCAPGYTVDVLEPGLAGVRTIRMRGNVLDTGGILSSGELELNLERVDAPERITEFAVLVEYAGDGMRLDREAPLVLTADADTFRLQPDSLPRPWERFDRDQVDQLRYPVHADTIRRLAAASEGTMAVRIGPWTERRRIPEAARASLRRFVEEHLRPESIITTPVPARPREERNPAS